MSEKIGEIRVTEIPYVAEGNKYLAEVRAFKPITRLEWDFFDVLSPLNTVSIEKWESVKRLSGRFGKALETVDEMKGDRFFHYRFYVSSKEDYDPEDIASELQSHLKDNEGCKVQTVLAKRIKKFPWERPKVKAKIPITKEMFEKMMKKVENGFYSSKKDSKVERSG